MYEHHDLQSAIEQRLRDFSASRNSEWYINTEEHINPAVRPASRRIDVAVKTNQSNQEGYAIEIKTTSSDRYFVHRQLRDYLIAGFRPILVAPIDFHQKIVAQTLDVRVIQVVKFLGATFVEVTETDPFEFQVREDRLPSNDNLRLFFRTPS